MTVYKFKNEDLLPIKNSAQADAQELGEAFAKLKDDNDEIKPAALVEAASHKSHVAHKHFDWDNDVAGPKWRLHQARKLIACIYLAEGDKHAGTQAFISISSGNGVGYRAAGDVATSQNLLDRLLIQAKSELDGFQMRYSMFKNFAAKAKKLNEEIAEEIEVRKAKRKRAAKGETSAA